MFESIRSSVQNLGYFTDAELALLVGRLKVIPLARGGYLLREGQVCRAVYFVNRGSFRHYQVMNEIDEINLNLFIENDWMFDYQSFTSQKPSRALIQAAENSEVFELNVYDLHALIGESSTFFRLGHLLESALESSENRTANLTPETKYRKLLQTKPQLLQRFPLKHIASYLGITPETLSRVRKKLARSPDFLI
ncbi:Crp/Fnr family transcriptional regulator [Salmonirosea aquatica]|uniref:Cyclic nucleotide-binding domain-containing protein n=1 Tax=Salmonirosea aquatica TaxID=2654236 RepID=A0A7C9BS92_9BACT|nr:cyclic nucleotide-binding domain-containing protein [Cytophagaceae bacterium SJW1-29]